MRYLVIHEGDAPFYTKWFEPENNWVEGMTVIDLFLHKYTQDGNNWLDIKEDHL